jgi:protocatechuate 3,4-dioxygenase beta subunit
MTNRLNRRSFIRFASVGLAVPVVGLGALRFKHDLLTSPNGKNEGAASAWRVTIVSDKEPGEPLIVSGTVYALDGKTPLPGATLWVYQTDATGNYSPPAGQDNRYTRIHGQMLTNKEGKYEFRTIRPASYPGRKVPAHIHASLSAPGFPEYWIDEFLFAGDPLISEAERRKAQGGGTPFYSILKLTRGADGILRGTRDIRIERCSNNCTRH